MSDRNGAFWGIRPLVTQSPPPWVIVSDFDGTITQEDLVVTLATNFSEENYGLIQAMQSGSLSLRDGLERVFLNLPSQARSQYEAYIRAHGRLRAGFQSALTAFGDWQVPFFVASNGLDFIVQPLLASMVDASQIYCNRASFARPQIRIDWTWPCAPECHGACGLCKPGIVNHLRAEFQAPVVFIGDGRTDYLGAQAADLVFARASLARHLDRHHLPYFPYETFDDVRRQLHALRSQILRTNSHFRTAIQILRQGSQR